jgi:hypothetical protein
MYCTECVIGIIQNAGLPLGSASPVLGVMRGDVRGRLATTEALSYILQRPIRSVQYGQPLSYILQRPIRSVQILRILYCTECIIGIIQNAGTPSLTSWI